jgi:hypothetical protein
VSESNSPCLSCVALRDQVAGLREQLADLKKQLEDKDREHRQQLRQKNREYMEMAVGLSRHFQRDPDPATEKEASEIVRLRHEDSETWTWRKLAERFKSTADAVRKIHERRQREIERTMDVLAELVHHLPPEHREHWKRKALQALYKLHGYDAGPNG